MAIGSNNPFPSVLVVEGTVPATPSAGQQRVYIDSTTHLLKVVNSSGTASNVGATAVTDATITTSDITTNNASTSKHGFLLKLDNTATHYMNGQGAWGTPAGSGSVATDAIWDAAGDLVQGTGADTAAKLSLGAAGTVVGSTGSTNAYAYPPGYELDYVQKTTNTNITATTEGTANTILTGASVTYDGAPVIVDWFTPSIQTTGPSAGSVYVILYEGGTVIGYLCGPVGQVASEIYGSQSGLLRFSPGAGAHTYTIKGIVTTGTGIVSGGTAGGTGTFVPTFMRITKV